MTLQKLPSCRVCGDVNPELACSPRCGACGVPHGEGVDNFHAEIKQIMEQARSHIARGLAFDQTLLQASRSVYADYPAI